MDRWSNYVLLASLLHLFTIELNQASNTVSTVSFTLFSALSSRVGFYVSTFQSLAGFEEKFHKEIGRVRLDYGPALKLNLDTKLSKQLIVWKLTADGK